MGIELADIAVLAHIEAVKQLKARYFRFVDTKAWQDLRGLFTPDGTLHFTERDFGVEPADLAVARIARTLAPDVVSVHRGSNPEITPLDDHAATGIWPMIDELYFPPDRENIFGLLWLRGFGYYYERYVRDDSGWRIAALRLDRTHVLSAPLPMRAGEP